MKDYKFEFEVDGKMYPLVFNLNVMETIQAKYGSCLLYTSDAADD